MPNQSTIMSYNLLINKSINQSTDLSMQNQIILIICIEYN
jgi:hypothetical protein